MNKDYDWAIVIMSTTGGL